MEDKKNRNQKNNRNGRNQNEHDTCKCTDDNEEEDPRYQKLKNTQSKDGKELDLHGKYHYSWKNMYE